MYFDKLDVHLWKNIQDKFSEEVKLAVYTIDRDGEEVVVSGKQAFLIELIKSKRKDILKERNYRQLNDLEEGEVALYDCFGAVFIVTPVFLHDRMIGGIIAGPVGKKDYEYNELAARMDVDASELADSAKEIEEKSQEEINLYRKMISIMASLVPKISYQKQSRDDKISELTALQSISKMMNSTLELDEILRYIMNFLVKSLHAADCSVFVRGEEGEKKYFLHEAVQNLTPIEKAVAKKAEEEQHPIVVKDIGAKFNVQVRDDYNAILSIPLKLRDNIIGTINLYGDFVGNIKDEQLSFISVMANQVAIAIANAQRYSAVKDLAVNDKLTGVFNRRHFMELLEKEIAQGMSAEHTVSLILMDIDSFGKYNNTHGHPKGDELLKGLSKVVKDSVREEDIVGRYGGEEFIVLLPNLKSNDAMETAKRIQEAVYEKKFEGEESQPNGKVTISVGLVSCMDTVRSSDLIKEADAALYKAKNTGKNKVVQRIILKDNLRTEASS